MGEGGGEEELYISRVSPSPVRSFGRFGLDMDMLCALGADISGEPRSHFQFNLLKALSKSHTVFHRRGRSRRDRASFIAIRQRPEWRAPIGIRIHVDDVCIDIYVSWYHPCRGISARLTNSDHRSSWQLPEKLIHFRLDFISLQLARGKTNTSKIFKVIFNGKICDLLSKFYLCKNRIVCLILKYSHCQH